MSIRFLCSNCSQLLKIATRKAGTDIVCPSCGHSQSVPFESLEFAAKTGGGEAGSRFAYGGGPSFGKSSRSKGQSPVKEESEIDRWLNDFWSDNERLLQKDKTESKFGTPVAVPHTGRPPIPAPPTITDDFLDGLIPPDVPKSLVDKTDSVPPPIVSGPPPVIREDTYSPTGKVADSVETDDFSVPPVIGESVSRFEAAELAPPIIARNFSAAFETVVGEIAAPLELSPFKTTEVIQAPPVIRPERPAKFDPNTLLSNRERQELLYNRELHEQSKTRLVLLYVFMHLLTLSIGIAIGFGGSHYISGLKDAENQVADPIENDPVRIDGLLVYVSPEGISQADARAIFLILPADTPPEHPVSCIALRPQDRFDDIQKDNSLKITEFGGYYERTDERGTMAITIPKPGSYYVLMLSSHSMRPPGDEVDEKTIRILEKYIITPKYLIGQFKYTLKKYEFSHDSRTIEHNFFRNEADL